MRKLTRQEAIDLIYGCTVLGTGGGGSLEKGIAMVEKEFNVTVTDVRTLIRNGKKTKFSKGKHAYPGITHRQDKKFAYVTLKEGDSIKVFDTPEEDNKTSAKEAKADKKAKADKNAGKENK